MPPQTGRRWTKRTLVLALYALATPLVCIALLAGLGKPGPHGHSDNLRDLPQSAAIERIEQLVELGDASVDQLVPLLADARRAVSDAALEGLSGRLDRWQLLSDREAFPRIARLAASLAAQAGHWDQAGRERAARLANRLLLWPVNAEPAQSRQFVADCQGILQLVRSQPVDATGRPVVRLAVDTLPPGLTTPASLPRRTVPSEP